MQKNQFENQLEKLENIIPNINDCYDFYGIFPVIWFMWIACWNIA